MSKPTCQMSKLSKVSVSSKPFISGGNGGNGKRASRFYYLFSAQIPSPSTQKRSSLDPSPLVCYSCPLSFPRPSPIHFSPPPLFFLSRILSLPSHNSIPLVLPPLFWHHILSPAAEWPSLHSSIPPSSTKVVVAVASIFFFSALLISHLQMKFNF